MSFAAASLNSETLFDYGAKLERTTEIERKMAEPDFWNNQERAQATVAELKGLNALVKPIKEFDRSLDDLNAMLEMAEEDESFAAEVPGELERLERVLGELELKGLLNGPNDGRGAIMTINARDGGVDANDWAEMLLRMYIQWAKKQGYDVEILDRQDNEEAGISTATIAVRGPMAYGYLRGESGMHRLVRISPFNAEGKRMTSFAAVDVSPEVNDDVEIEIKDEDVRIDKFCSSGAGGQHVNKTESAIRLTHAPTGIVVQCQNERSQHKNLAQAYKMLRARLLRLQEETREAEGLAKYQSQARSGFGSQIRNYFQHPDQRIKDQRTGYGESHFQSVMDGDIQAFLDAVLRWRAGQPVAQAE